MAAQELNSAPGFVNPDGYTKEQALASVGEGWEPLIEGLWRYITAEKGLYGNQVDTPVTVIQVKEKFGTLRFYFKGGNDFFRGAVSMAEALSASMCEVCGAPGEANTLSGYVQTLCPTHIADREERRAKRWAEGQ